jgi:hypothetical protein
VALGERDAERYEPELSDFLGSPGRPSR